MEYFISLNSQVAGKDKIARLLQYSCRAIWDSLNSKNEAQLALVHQLKTLENLLSSFRKCTKIIKNSLMRKLVDLELISIEVPPKIFLIKKD
jgi:peroxin-11B